MSRRRSPLSFELSELGKLTLMGFIAAVWSSESWLKEHALPLSQSGGVMESRPETEEKVEQEAEEIELEQ